MQLEAGSYFLLPQSKLLLSPTEPRHTTSYGCQWAPSGPFYSCHTSAKHQRQRKQVCNPTSSVTITSTSANPQSRPSRKSDPLKSVSPVAPLSSTRLPNLIYLLVFLLPSSQHITPTVLSNGKARSEGGGTSPLGNVCHCCSLRMG